MPLEVTMCQMKSCILHIHGVLGPGCILRTGVRRPAGFVHGVALRVTDPSSDP